MFAFPEIISAPVLSSLGTGGELWPTAGGVLAWMLLAALVGSALGILRQVTTNSVSARRASSARGVAPVSISGFGSSGAPFATRCPHRQAA